MRKQVTLFTLDNDCESVLTVKCPWKLNFYISIKTTPQALLQRCNIIAIALISPVKQTPDKMVKHVSIKGIVHRKVLS